MPSVKVKIKYQGHSFRKNGRNLGIRVSQTHLVLSSYLRLVSIGFVTIICHFVLWVWLWEKGRIKLEELVPRRHYSLYKWNVTNKLFRPMSACARCAGLTWVDFFFLLFYADALSPLFTERGSIISFNPFQITNFRLFHIERVCTRQFQNSMKVAFRTGRKHCGKRRNCSLRRQFFLFPHCFQKTRKKQGLFRKRFNTSSRKPYLKHQWKMINNSFFPTKVFSILEWKQQTTITETTEPTYTDDPNHGTYIYW